MQEFNQKLNSLGEWVIRLVYLNFLWMGFTILGLGILGVFPATSALFSVLRKALINDKRDKLPSAFFKYYKKDFWKSNMLGYSFLLIMVVIWIDYRLVSSIESYWSLAVGYLVLLLLVLSMLSFCVLFPIYTHYQLSFFQYIKNAFLFPLANILTVILMAVVLFLTQFIFSELPGFILFIGVSFPAFIITKLSLQIFNGKSLSINGFFNIFRKSKNESMYY